MYHQLKEIIDRTEARPTIVNPESNFVVVTYWWGRGNKNNNTSRPCTSYYEGLLTQTINVILQIMNTVELEASRRGETDQSEINEKIKVSVLGFLNVTKFKNVINSNANTYRNMLSEYCNLDPKDSRLDEKLIQTIERYKTQGKIEPTYEFKTVQDIRSILQFAMSNIVHMNIDHFMNLHHIVYNIKNEKAHFTSEVLHEMSEYERITLRNHIQSLNDQKKSILQKIKSSMRTPIQTDIGRYSGKSVNDILTMELRYLLPLQYEEMITKWENECRRYNCNYMAVEYPEFARPGGYQLAINAKPLFIKKALELCGPLNVIYIDGDMFIRKYPHIFDLKDVDFMARGWWIDPRSSYQVEDSITYDPYTFETSGGTMFFSQSKMAKLLIDTWIQEAEKPHQQGKADDRVLSLIFNTRKYLLDMKIIQLPIEYLWLTLDYDQRLTDAVFYDYIKLRNAIFIEHPECLTTEDTASGSGASSDRTPKFYNFLDDNLYPASEEFHEAIMFPTKDLASSFKDYLEYMGDAYYLDDGNPLLYELNYVVPGQEREENEQPLYITKFEHGLGNKPYKEDRSFTVNQISELNFKRARTIDVEEFIENGNLVIKDDVVEIIPVSSSGKTIEPKFVIALIIKYLGQEKEVLYHPIHEADVAPYYSNLMEKKNTSFAGLEFVFTPILNSLYFSNFFKPLIDETRPILFRPGNDVLTKYLSMYMSIEELSVRMRGGAYEFISRTRVGYNIPPRLKKQVIKLNPHTASGTGSCPVGYGLGMEQVGQGRRRKHKNKVNKTHHYVGGQTRQEQCIEMVERYIDDYETSLNERHRLLIGGGIYKNKKRMHMHRRTKRGTGKGTRGNRIKRHTRRNHHKRYNRR
jgi:hypothetical protein